MYISRNSLQCSQVSESTYILTGSTEIAPSLFQCFPKDLLLCRVRQKDVIVELVERMLHRWEKEEILSD